MMTPSRPRNILIIGASRGIGLAVAEYFVNLGDQVFAVSRNQPPVGAWIPADISTPEGIGLVGKAVQNVNLDALLYMGGTWERGAFTDQYDFFASSDAETRYVLAVNTIAPIELSKQLAQNLAQAENPRIVFIGALSGFDNAATVEVANTASKFGLRGAAQALRLALSSLGIGITVINPGNVATAEVQEDIATGRFDPQIPIPLADLISAVAWVLSLSPPVDVSEITLHQKF